MESPGGSMKNLAFFFAVWVTTFLLLLFVVAESLPKFQYEQTVTAGYQGSEEGL